MAQLDPSIILQAGKVPMIDPGQLLEQRAQIQLRNLGLQKQQRAEDQAIQAQQTQQQVGQAYASGDGAGARKMALGAGNFDLVGKLDQMDDNGRKRAFELSQATAPLLLSLKKVPPPMRAEALAQLAPELQARGFTPEHIQQLAQPGVLSDQYLDSQGVAAQTIAEYNKAHEAYTLGEGQQRFDGDNNLIASGPEKFHAITTPEGGTTTIFGSNGSTGAPGAPQGGGDPASGQRYVNGWSPRARNGGDNSDASVDNYIAHVARTLGVDPNAPLPPSAIPQLAAAMAQFESGGKSNAISNRNNNPGNIKASGGGFQKFDSPQSGLAAQQALLGRYMSRGQNTIKSIIEGVPARAGSNGPLTIRGAPKPVKAGWRDMTPQEVQQRGLPPGAYQQSPEGKIEPVLGKQAANAGSGPAGTRQQQGVARQKISGLRSIEAQLDRVDAAMADMEKNGYSGFIGGHVPGALNDASAKFDKSVAALSPLFRALTRVPGEGSMSDYEGKLAAMALPGRTDNHAGRMEALQSMRELVKQTRAGYEEFLGTPEAAPAAQPARGGGNVIRYDAQGNRIK